MVTTAILIIIYDCSLQSYHFLVHYVLDNIFVSDRLLCILLFHLIVTTMLRRSQYHLSFRAEGRDVLRAVLPATVTLRPMGEGSWEASLEHLSSEDDLTSQLCFHPGASQVVLCRRCKRLRFDAWVGEIPLEQEMATHFRILAWEIPWTEEGAWWLQPMGWEKLDLTD